MTLTSDREQVTATWWGRLDYETSLNRMMEMHSRRSAGECGDSIYYVEHPPVITYGRATSADDIDNRKQDIPAISVNRGGLATYHAPGQMVAYPVIDLKSRRGSAPDIHAYLRALEQGIMDFVNSEYGLPVHRRAGFTGVWTHGFIEPDAGNQPSAPGRKLASIGITARRWVTLHGLALNVDLDMSGFSQIVPCGITDAAMTSIKCEFDRAGKEFPARPMEDNVQVFHPYLINALAKEGWGQVNNVID